MEAQIDRLVGPTHHFGGLGIGNLASQSHRGEISNPRAAALQGLDKMAVVARLGVPQFVLPPQQRPCWELLHRFGFTGPDAQVLHRALAEAPALFAAAMSSSAMWTANAATVSPSWDAPENRLSLTVANLNASLHRAIEPDETLDQLQRLLPTATRLNRGLPGGMAARDEGAANHMRLAADILRPGLHLYVFGDGLPQPTRYMARQSEQASRAIPRLHDIPPDHAFFLKQHPEAIDAGAFHNDVVAASHGDLLLHHELAFYDAEEKLEQLAARFESIWGRPLKRIVVHRDELSLEDAVSCYLFNSQIVSPSSNGSASDADGPAVLICPAQVRDCEPARGLVERWRDQLGLFSEVHYVELRQSMAGGGGPACLRLRVPVTPGELADCNHAMRWSQGLDAELRQIVEESYPTAVTLSDLAELDRVRDAERVTWELQRRLLE